MEKVRGVGRKEGVRGGVSGNDCSIESCEREVGGERERGDGRRRRRRRRGRRGRRSSQEIE